MRRVLSLSAVILLLWVGLALAATNVYYSVCPFGTGNLLSGGSPTIVVDASGNATLTLGGAAFADNIGQGVCVEYNGIVSFIDSITDSTHFHLVTALGESASFQTSTAVTSIHHVFAGLSDAVAGASGASLLNGSDLTSLDVLLNLACYYDHDDYTPDTRVIFDGYVTDEGRYARVYTPRGLAYGESVYSQRSEDGIWDDNLYRISPGRGYTPIEPRDPYLVFDGLQIETADDYRAIYATSWYFADGVSLTFKNLIIRSSAASATGKFGLYLGANHSINYYVENCIIYGFSQDSGCGGIYVGGVSSSAAYIYNSVICGNSIGVNRAAGTVSVVNCAVFNNTDDFNGTVAVTYTASDDNPSGTGNVDISPGATEADDWEAAFTDYTNGDFSLVSGSPLIDAGTDLSAVMDSLDIIGTVRPQGDYWDIGAFEYVVSGGNGSKWNGITPAKWNGVDWSNLKWNGM
jgi:hypothetical protein